MTDTDIAHVAAGDLTVGSVVIVDAELGINEFPVAFAVQSIAPQPDGELKITMRPLDRPEEVWLSPSETVVVEVLR